MANLFAKAEVSKGLKVDSNHSTQMAPNACANVSVFCVVRGYSNCGSGVSHLRSSCFYPAKKFPAYRLSRSGALSYCFLPQMHRINTDAGAGVMGL